MQDRYTRCCEWPTGITAIDIPRWQGTTLVFAATASAQRLVRGATTAVAPDGAVLASLEDGRVVAMVCSAGDDIRVVALPAGEDGFLLAMSEGFLTSLFALLAGLWTCGEVMTGVGRITGLVSQQPFPGIAPGLEHLAWSLQVRAESRQTPPGLQLEEWRRLVNRLSRQVTGSILHDRLHALCPLRRPLFEASFLAAVAFTWLHEMAHVLHGHLDTAAVKRLGLDLSEVASEGGTSAPPAPGAETMSAFHYGVEIEADAWAARRLAAQSEHRGDGDMICARLLGVTAVFMLLHGKNVLLDQPDHALRHPPIWYRAILTMRNAAPPSQFERILDELQGLAHVHPLFGEWLDPIVRGEGFRAAATLEAKVVAEFAPWIAELAPLRQEFSRS